MELLSNLAWFAVAVALWLTWLARRRAGSTLSSGIAVQLTTLAVLTLILLPVISVSDDLQASQNPAEVERTCVRSDQHLLGPEVLPQAPAALTIIFSCLLLASPRTIAFLRPPSLPRGESMPHVRSLGSRPPPRV